MPHDEEYEAEIRALVDGFPPLSADQRIRLGGLLQPVATARTRDLCPASTRASHVGGSRAA